MRNDFCSNFLEHSAKGKTWANHRYVARIRLASGKYFYFYDMKTYQNYLKKQGGGTKKQGQYAKKDPNEDVKKAISSNQSTLSGYSSKSTAEKKAITGNLINNGKAASTTLTAKASSETVSSGKTKAQELLEKAKAKTDTSSTKKGSSGSSSSKSKSSSGKSKSSSSSKAKSTKESTGSKSKTGSSSKEKSTKETTAKVTTKKDAKLKAEERAFTSESLKKLYGVKDEDVNTHESTEKMLETMKSYKDGAFGYITVGDKTYKWTKENGNIVFKDFKTDKEVTLPSALKDIQEFRTDKKKKK